MNGPSDESNQEAKRWLNDIFTHSGVVTIRNNFIQHFGEEDYTKLFLSHKGVSIQESFDKGHTEMAITGKPCDVAYAAVQVEAMLCRIHKSFVQEERRAMSVMTKKRVTFQRKTVDHNNPTYLKMESDFIKEGLFILKVQKTDR